MKLHFNVTKSLLEGAKKLAPTLKFTITENEGILVKAICGNRIGVTLKNNVATVFYRDRVQFFRGLGILIENAKKSSDFEIAEDGYFKNISAMIDSSRCGVPTVKTVKRIIDYMAIMGYTMVMLYTEDVIELEGRPYFGYMRGRYTTADLREIDDYAYEYGIEVIPCLECYGHMEKYLVWGEASPIKDTAGVMMATSSTSTATFRPSTSSTNIWSALLPLPTNTV